MGKYNFEITEINPRTTHGKILTNVKPGSKVLECGCASGYMTKYMAQEMGCKVFIVEVDKEAYNTALKYAEDGFLGSLEQSGWVNHFKRKGYDYVLFADVLEHLKDPVFALRMAKELLKDDGRIIVSIPNICHNDIIIRMIEDRFNYTDMGLLDSTHIRFWGAGNVTGLFRTAGFEIDETDAVWVATGGTEQFGGTMTDEEKKVADYLKSLRPLGEVYQFVFVLKKEGAQ